MRLSEMRVCDACGGPLVRPPVRYFWTVQVSGAIVNPKAFQALALAAQHGVPLSRIETGDDAVTVLADDSPAMMHRLQICADCAHAPMPLATVVARRREQLEADVAAGRPA